jgi:hypothetical protein
MKQALLLVCILFNFSFTDMSQTKATFSSYHGGKRYDFEVTTGQLMNCPAWLEGQDNRIPSANVFDNEFDIPSIGKLSASFLDLFMIKIQTARRKLTVVNVPGPGTIESYGVIGGDI